MNQSRLIVEGVAVKVFILIPENPGCPAKKEGE
jgi:hypothetical protein